MWLAMKIISWAWPNDKTPWQAQRDLKNGQTETDRSQTGRSQGERHGDQGAIVKGRELAIQTDGTGLRYVMLQTD
jgi:hypothetical protein